MARFDVFEEVARLRAAGARFAVATVARTADATSAKAGAKAVIDGDGSIRGFLGGACVQNAARQAAAAALATGEARLIRVEPAEQATSLRDADGAPLYRSGCPSGGTVELLIEPIAPPLTLAILGSGPVAEALGRVARPMGWRLVHAAPASEHGRVEADARVAGFALTAVGLDERDVVVVAAQGAGDRAALAAALASPAAHVMMVASARKARTLVAKLHQEGFAEALTARLEAPAGLDLGGVAPEEIAIAIVAGIVTRKARRRVHVAESAAEQGAGRPRKG